VETKDIITITLAALAFVFSIASFIWTFRQRTSEDRRSIRKAFDLPRFFGPRLA
jgi:hypothetical protein